jgi:hypothetical protein
MRACPRPFPTGQHSVGPAGKPRPHHQHLRQQGDDGDGHSSIHGWRAYDSSRARTATWLPSDVAGGSHQRDRTAAQHVVQFGQRCGALLGFEVRGLAPCEFVEPCGLV